MTALAPKTIDTRPGVCNQCGRKMVVASVPGWPVADRLERHLRLPLMRSARVPTLRHPRADRPSDAVSIVRQEPGVIDVDAEPDPPADWFKAELDACRKRIAELEAENAALRERVP